MRKLSSTSKASSSTEKHWVDVSFADLSQGASFLGGKRKDSRTWISKAELPEYKKLRKRKGDGQSQASCSTIIQSVHHETWVDQYSPRSQADLAVHKKKIEEVERWMKTHCNKGKGGVLLLLGPSGCGKTATVQVLAQELGCRIQEWTNPTSLEPSPYNLHLEGVRLNGFSCSSQVAQFQDFLLRVNKYNCLKMMGEDAATNQRLILVEDLPNQFYRQPASLHDILRTYVKASRYPIVFIVSDSQSGDLSSRFLFPKDIQDELHIGVISFNPVAPTTMMKVLSRIATSEVAKSRGKISAPDVTLLDLLCSGCSGDIRSAINSLQFASLPDTSIEKALWRKTDRSAISLGKVNPRINSRKKAKSKEKKEHEEEQAIGGKDASLFLFRALGKVLHCKRGSTVDVECSTAPGLPSHLMHHYRETLLVNPELVVERSHMSAEIFNLYLHQNYLDFFSEVEDVERASEYLSDADLLTADWTFRSTMCEYGTSVATRGLLHSNSRQVSVGFRPLHKPNWLLINKTHRDNCIAAQSLFTIPCMTPISLQTELLPYLAKLNNPMRNQAQITFVQDVGQLLQRQFPKRLPLEALTDKEPGQMALDREEEEEQSDQNQVVDALPTSQLTTTYANIEEEELLIEEYFSD